MNASKLKKQIKKNWKQWKRRTGTTALCVIVVGMAWWGLHLSEKVQSLLNEKPQIAVETLQYLQNSSFEEESKEDRYFLQMLNDSDVDYRVIFQKNYVCGQEEQVLGQMRSDHISELIHKNPTWTGHLDLNGDVWLVESISDLSPVCKQKAYMSMDADGNLTMYEGPPQKEKVLKTFFQLDINSMESTLPEGVLKELYDGIRIQDIDEYNSVISTFSDYAREHSENVMKRTN
ncbi:BofC C-terminal domain-containing protein [Paenibacillus glacialis]|uniref:Bypass of forespore C C-terminal domain-containing protein n=1 Tax=Paenibacillus glacialis TaxID=494026 RepID=A0A168DHB2_9BACL|nr:BofC C-terminal domain-containing protein [Paenibacillus glacialis]OAB34202.1 hypothetical protein PGLA_25250 [Paenibacillus glacialis]